MKTDDMYIQDVVDINGQPLRIHRYLRVDDKVICKEDFTGRNGQIIKKGETYTVKAIGYYHYKFVILKEKSDQFKILEDVLQKIK